METTAIVTSVALGALAATLFQISKGSGWPVWLTRILAVGSGLGIGYQFGDSGIDGGLVSSVSTLATHSVAFNSTKLGDALAKVRALPRALGVISELAANTSKAISNDE